MISANEALPRKGAGATVDKRIGNSPTKEVRDRRGGQGARKLQPKLTHGVNDTADWAQGRLPAMSLCGSISAGRNGLGFGATACTDARAAIVVPACGGEDVDAVSGGESEGGISVDEPAVAED